MVDKRLSEIIYNEARLILSSPTLAQCPADTGGEAAFAGYSNTGNSSVLNAITGVHSLARTSKTPGRTRLFNFFSLGHGRRLVDLPGYGYARVSAVMKQQWEAALSGYLENRRSLLGLMLIMDVRHPLKAQDLNLLEWCREGKIPVRILLNKADKLSRGAGMKVLHETGRQVGDGVTVQLFSAHSRLGVDASRQWLDALFKRAVYKS